MVDGFVESEGRLEFRFIGKEWRSVCSSTSHREEFTHICQKLGYDSILSWYNYETSLFGGSNGPMFFLNMAHYHDGCGSENFISLRCLEGRVINS